VYRYRACIKLFAAPSVYPCPLRVPLPRVYQAFRGTLNRARTPCIRLEPLSMRLDPLIVSRMYRFVARNSDKNQKKFLLHMHLSLESASTLQISQPSFQQKFQFFQIQHARRTWMSEKMTSLVKLTYFLFFKRIMSQFI
jgi:hypothetical protein